MSLVQSTLGPRLRELRRGRGLALTEVAEATNISTSFLSMIENGKSDITFSRLIRLVEFYGIDITELLPEPPSSDPIVVRRDEQQHIYSPAEGLDLVFLTRATRHIMLPMQGIYAPGAEARFDAREGEVFVHVLEGALEIDLAGGEPLHLEEGDSAYFRMDTPQVYRNASSGTTRVIGAGSPPPF